MKLLSSLVILCCVVACGSSPTEGTTSTQQAGYGGEVNTAGGGDNSLHCGEWHYVTTWVNGNPVPQLQPIICAQGPNFNTGDPSIDVGDPDPWERQTLPGQKNINMGAPQMSGGSER